MNDNNINVFISSKIRDVNSSPSDFRCYFPNGAISCGETQGIKINVISFDILNSMYNINQYNYRFNIIISGTSKEEGFVSGSYNVNDIVNFMNSNYSAYFTVQYSKVLNKFIFKQSQSGISIKIINCGSVLGLSNGTTYAIGASLYSTTIVNMVNYNKIIVRANNLDFEINSLENITNTPDNNSDFEISNILLWMNRSEVPPFQTISYNNFDGGNSFSYNLYNKSINTLDITLTNELGQVIDDALDWTMAIQFTIYERNDNQMIKSLNITNAYLREIYVYVNIFFNILIRRKI